ncbi:hypothetical protein [Streptomyces cavernae]|uniref:hypothetical protein n=1 Tax=Streptomyces cavernae TaxID=2259034 RepID=UPI000FEBDDE6|nr:hypothetical protein [Streptomyces cavernae]
MFEANWYAWLHQTAETMPAELAIDGRERPVTRYAVLRVLRNELRPMLTYGPTYQPTVADRALRALALFHRGKGKQAVDALDQACEAAADVRAADAYDPAERYVTASSWAVSQTVGSGINGAVLNVHDLDHEAPNARGGLGVVVWHPVHDGREFTSSHEARAYALRMGLLRRFAPRFQLV